MHPYLVAEIGCNHCGDFEMAKAMIKKAAVFCEVPCVKFQKRNPSEVLSEQEYHSAHPNPRNSYGETYGAHREFLEFSIEQHKILQEHCHECGIEYSTSVWDITSAKQIAGLNPPFIKIPSACNTWFEMARVLCGTYDGGIHVALGMTSEEEIDNIVDFYAKENRAKDVVLYHCTSGYPVPFDDLNLLEIERLRTRYGAQVAAIGFSGHHLGIAVDIAAYTLGARYIERHFTLDRTLKGTDHAASLEPDGLRRLWRDLDATQRSLCYKPKDLLDIEEPQRRKLKWDRGR